MVAMVFRHNDCFEVRFVAQAGGCERPHTHDALIVSAVAGGNLQLQIHSTNEPLTPGIIAAVGPHTLHCVNAYSDDFRGVYVLEVFHPYSLHDSTRQTLWPQGHWQETHWQMFGGQRFHDRHFIPLCQQLLADDLDLTGKTQRLVHWLQTLFTRRYPDRHSESPAERQVARHIRDMLDAHTGQTPPFAQIAATCQLSKERCNRLFRQSYGLSMQAYFLNEKATQARELLASDLPLAEVALQCGFYDQSHCSRIFREIFQITPAAYRALLQPARQSHTRTCP